MRSENDSGRLELKGDVLTYHSEHYGSWELSLKDVSVIGEYTNEDGPFADDWFLVFVEKGEPDWNEASVYAAGKDEVLADLESAFGIKLTCALHDSVTFKSRVLWPRTMLDEKLFEFHPDGPFRNMQVLCSRILGV